MLNYYSGRCFYTLAVVSKEEFLYHKLRVMGAGQSKYSKFRLLKFEDLVLCCLTMLSCG
jgi:hypothetical protein